METVDVQMDEGMLEEIEKRAESLHLFSSEYCGLIVSRWLLSEEPLESINNPADQQPTS